MAKLRPIDWEAITDGRPWCMRLKRDFVQMEDFLQQAYTEANSRGKVVRVSRDKLQPRKLVWLQFADAEIQEGNPCPCGNPDVIRVHTFFARCPVCRRQLLVGRGGRSVAARPTTSTSLSPVEDDEEPNAAAPSPDTPPPSTQQLPAKQQLRGYADVRLVPYENSASRERCYGRAYDASGKPVLLLVDFPLQNGHRIPDPLADGQFVHRLAAWPVEPFAEVIDFDGISDAEK